MSQKKSHTTLRDPTHRILSPALLEQTKKHMSKLKATSELETHRSTPPLPSSVKEMETDFSSYCSPPTSQFVEDLSSRWEDGVIKKESSGTHSLISDLSKRLVLRRDAYYDPSTLTHKVTLIIEDRLTKSPKHHLSFSMDDHAVREMMLRDIKYVDKILIEKAKQLIREVYLDGVS